MTCVSVYSIVKERPARTAGRTPNLGGAERDRTADPLVANQVLSQLSYSPLPCINRILRSLLVAPEARLRAARAGWPEPDGGPR